MRGARWRKVRADLLTNKLQSGLAVMSLAVGTTAVGAMHLAGTTVDTSFESSFSAANPPTAVLVTDPFDPELVADIAAHPAAGQVEGRRLHQTQTTGPNGETVSVELVAMTDFDHNHVARIEPLTGTWPPEPGRVVLERASIAELGAELSDRVVVERPGEPPAELMIDGIVSDVFEVAPTLGGPVRGYVAMDTMVELTGSDHLDALYLRAAEQPESPEKAPELVATVRADVLEPAGVAIAANLVDEPGEHRASNSLSFLTLTMQLLALLTLAVAISLVINTVAALLAQQRTQVGVMKAIGATTRQLMAQYLTYLVALSAVAVAVSVPISLLLGRAVAGFVADLANIDLAPTGLPVATILMQVATATLLPVAAAILTVRRAAHTTVREAITDHGLTGGARSRRVPLPFSRPTLLAIRNAARNRARLGLTVLTVALCGAVLVGVINTGSGLGAISEQVAGYSDYDIEISLNELVPRHQAAVLEDDGAVASVEGWLRRQGRRSHDNAAMGDNIDLVGVPAPSASISPTLRTGRWLKAGDDHAIVINTHVANTEPDLDVGDDILLEIEGHQQQWRIVGISSTTLVGPVAYVAADDLTATLGVPGETNLLAIQLAADAEPANAAERLADLARDIGLPVAQAQTHDEIRASFESMFDIATALLLAVGAILAVVAVIGVAGTMTIGVVEQTREIGVLRTLGATTRAVRRLLLLQGVAIAAAGGLLGVLLAVPVSVVLGGAIETTLINDEFPTGFSWVGIAIWIVVALGIGALGATHPSRVAARLTIRDTLTYE